MKEGLLSCWDSLRKQCPKLYKHRMGFECGEGWFNIICELSIALEKIIEKLDQEVAEEIYVTQVKEKYGTLRFYISTETLEISELIEAAEKLSLWTCESCGAAGSLRGGAWMSVRCDNCVEA